MVLTSSSIKFIHNGAQILSFIHYFKNNKFVSFVSKSEAQEIEYIAKNEGMQVSNFELTLNVVSN